MSTTVQAPVMTRGSTRWVQMLLGLLCMMAIASPQYVWTLLVGPLSTQFGATRAAIQWTFFILIGVQTFFSPFQGWLIERFGPRYLLATGGALTGLSWVLASYATSVTDLYLTYGLLGGLGTGIVYIGVVGQMVGWFPDRRGFAAGVAAAGYGMGAIVTTFPFADSLAASGTGPTLLQFGIIFGVVGVLAAIGLRAPPAQGYAVAPSSGGPLKDVPANASRDVPTGVMLKNPIFWLMLFMMACMSTSGLMVTAQIGPFAADQGYSKVMIWGFAAIPLALWIDRVCNGLTRPFFGWVSDRIGRENTMALAFALEGCAMLLWFNTLSNPVLFVLLSGVVFFGWGEIFSLFPSTLTDTFGTRYATKNYGCLYMAQGIGALFGGPLASLLHDSAGSWTPVFGVAIGADFLTAALALFVLRPMRARYSDSAVPARPRTRGGIPPIIWGKEHQDQINLQRSLARNTPQAVPSIGEASAAEEALARPEDVSNAAMTGSPLNPAIQSRRKVWTLRGLGVAAVLALFAWRFPEVIRDQVTKIVDQVQRAPTGMQSSSVTVSSDVAITVPREPELRQTAVPQPAAQVDAPSMPTLPERPPTPVTTSAADTAVAVPHTPEGQQTAIGSSVPQGNASSDSMVLDTMVVPDATFSPAIAAVVPRTLGGPGAAIANPAPQIDASTSSVLPEMVMMAGGKFLMGSNDDPSERPVHTVDVAPFLLAKHAITIREWQPCVDAKVCTLVPKGKPDEPLTNASWDDASQYAAWLSKSTNDYYRLPTEAEWEYAARAGTQTRYSWGNAFVPGKATCKNCGGEPVALSPPPVEAYPANQFGLYGMGSGVAEWVADCWHRDYQNAPHAGSTPWDVPGCRTHVLRGGSWVSDVSDLRSSSRQFYDAPVRYFTHGFRVARSVSPPK